MTAWTHLNTTTTSPAMYPTTDPPQMAGWFEKALLVLACVLAGFVGAAIRTHFYPGPVNATCYVSALGDKDPATGTPACYYGRPVR